MSAAADAEEDDADDDAEELLSMLEKECLCSKRLLRNGASPCSAPCEPPHPSEGSNSAWRVWGDPGQRGCCSALGILIWSTHLSVPSIAKGFLKLITGLAQVIG